MLTPKGEPTPLLPLENDFLHRLCQFLFYGYFQLWGSFILVSHKNNIKDVRCPLLEILSQLLWIKSISVLRRRRGENRKHSSLGTTSFSSVFVEVSGMCSLEDASAKPVTGTSVLSCGYFLSQCHLGTLLISLVTTESLVSASCSPPGDPYRTRVRALSWLAMLCLCLCSIC